ncbi:MAG: SRPBCC domain-containing protein [Bacteroidota bacterium]
MKIAALFFTFISTVVSAKEIRTEILIQAPPEKVWAILTDFNRYAEWNPFIRSVTGEVAVGKEITILLAPPESSEMTFSPTILAFEPNKELRWLGHFWFTGLFDGEHTFELIDNGNGTTTFKQSEDFGGILVPFFSTKLDVNTVNGFKLMNEKLKELAEKIERLE